MAAVYTVRHHPIPGAETMLLTAEMPIVCVRILINRHHEKRLAMSAIGTKRTSQRAQLMSAFGGKNILQTHSNVRF